MSQLWLFSQVRSYRKNYYSSSFQKNIFFWKFLPLFFSYGMYMHKINIYKLNYFFVTRRLTYLRNKSNKRRIFKKIFSKFLYRRSHKTRHGKYEFFDNERTYKYAPLYYRAPFFRSMYFSKLWIFKLSNYMFFKLHILISDNLTYDGKRWKKKSRRRSWKRRKRFFYRRRRSRRYTINYPEVARDVRSLYERVQVPSPKVKKRREQSLAAFNFFFKRSKYVFKIFSNKIENNNYFWF